MFFAPDTERVVNEPIYECAAFAPTHLAITHNGDVFLLSQGQDVLVKQCKFAMRKRIRLLQDSVIPS